LADVAILVDAVVGIMIAEEVVASSGGSAGTALGFQAFSKDRLNVDVRYGGLPQEMVAHFSVACKISTTTRTLYRIWQRLQHLYSDILRFLRSQAIGDTSDDDPMCSI